jgi:hypothetical protein
MFRFKLRTLLILTTIVAAILGWVEWNRHLVRARHALRRHPGCDWVAEGSYLKNYNFQDRITLRAFDVSDDATIFAATADRSLTWLRKKLGDFPFRLVKTAEPQLVPKIRSLFPEAICVVQPRKSDVEVLPPLNEYELDELDHLIQSHAQLKGF